MLTKQQVQNALKKVMDAIYGKDVRQSIHDLIKQCYDDLYQMSTVKVSNTKPTEEIVDLWINPEGNDEINIPEINDEIVASEDTWSSRRIKSLIDYMHGECNNLTENYTKYEVFENTICRSDGVFMSKSPDFDTEANTYGFVAEDDFYIWHDGVFDISETHLSLGLYADSDHSSDKLVGMYRHQHDTTDGVYTEMENSLPTVDDKLYVPKGYYVAISSTVHRFNFNTTYVPLGYKAHDGMKLGEAQLKQIENDLNIDILFDKDSYVTMTELFDGFTKIPGVNVNPASTPGGRPGIAPYAGLFDTYYFKAEHDFNVYGNSSLPDYICITLCDGDITGDSVDNVENNLKYIYRYRYEEFPTEDNQLSILKDQVFLITVTADAGFSLMTNYEKCGFYLSDKIKIHETPSSGLSFQNGILLDFKKSGTTDTLMIYKRMNNGEYYLGQLFERVPKTDINSDVWRLSNIRIYDSNFTATADEPVVLNGEWECAIQESGASDFMGGTMHGDEMYIFFDGWLDGKKLDFTSDFTLSGHKFELICASQLNRVGAGADIVCNHTKKYTYTSDYIKVDQNFTFLDDMQLLPSYITMFPVNRTYTKMSWRDSRNSIEDISQDNHAHVHTSGNKQKVFLWGDNLTATVDINCESKHTASLYISGSDSPRYNKVYFSFVGATGGSVKNGDVVKVSTTYTIDMNI